MSKPDDLLTVTEAAARLGLSPTQVRRLCQEGRIPATKYGKTWLVKESDCAYTAGPRTGRPKHITSA